VRDEELEHDVKKALDTAAFKEITVDVKNGVVRLTGIIPTGEQRLEAAQTARAVSGVRAVEDDLRLLVTAKNSSSRLRPASVMHEHEMGAIGDQRFHNKRGPRLHNTNPAPTASTRAPR
jgi:hypothetical protein